MNPQRTTGVRIKLRRPRQMPGLQLHKEIRPLVGLIFDLSELLLAHTRIARHPIKRAPLAQARDQRHFRQHAATIRLEQHARITWVQREARHLAAHHSNCALRIQGPQIQQQIMCPCECLRLWQLKPCKGLGLRNTRRRQQQ